MLEQPNTEYLRPTRTNLKVGFYKRSRYNLTWAESLSQGLCMRQLFTTKVFGGIFDSREYYTLFVELRTFDIMRNRTF